MSESLVRLCGSETAGNSVSKQRDGNRRRVPSPGHTNVCAGVRPTLVFGTALEALRRAWSMTEGTAPIVR